jgi:hypothetical protein
METEFPFVAVPEEVLPVVGRVVPGTRIYEKKGPEEECGPWYEVIDELFGPCVSPGGVAMYCPVTRAAVHKRIKEGRITVFLYHVTERKIGLFGSKEVVRESPYTYIPVSEIKAWKKELEERAISQGRVTREELEGTRPDWEGSFLDWRSRWRKDQGTKGGGA